jgi:hypothetical protein
MEDSCLLAFCLFHETFHFSEAFHFYLLMPPPLTLRHVSVVVLSRSSTESIEAYLIRKQRILEGRI